MERLIPGNMKKQSNPFTRKINITAKDVATIGMMVAIIEVSKAVLSFMPNVELTTFWLIMFTLYFGRKVGLVIPAFILVEGAIYGVHLWWIMYIYIWPLLVIITWIFRKTESMVFWSILSGIFGLCFGFLCSIVYFVIGFSAGGLGGGIATAFPWWISGIPWDLIHCVGNFTLMMVLYTPVRAVMNKYALESNVYNE